MKKAILIYFIFIILICESFGQNFSLDGNYPFQEESLLSIMKIDKNTITIKYENPSIKKDEKVFTFLINQYYGMPFIELSDKMPPEVAAWWDYDKNNYIETDNKILFLAFKGERTNIFAYTKGFLQERASLIATRYDNWGCVYKDCSSYLVEKNKVYSIDNLRKLAVDTPWVEGVEGSGIGEGFTIEKSPSGDIPRYLLIINGYISYEKPYLYKENNRVKKIKITGLKSMKTRELDVLDTPHPQTIDISFISISEDIRIEIADVYKGLKYDDTCLHYCCSFNEAVIPYEDTIGE